MILRLFVISLFLFSFCYSAGFDKKVKDQFVEEGKSSLQSIAKDNAVEYFSKVVTDLEEHPDTLNADTNKLIRSINGRTAGIITSPGITRVKEVDGHFSDLKEYTGKLGDYLAKTMKTSMNLFNDEVTEEEQQSLLPPSPLPAFDTYCFECFSGKKYCFKGGSASDKMYAMASVDKCDLAYMNAQKGQKNNQLLKNETNEIDSVIGEYSSYYKSKKRSVNNKTKKLNNEIAGISSPQYRSSIALGVEAEWRNEINAKENTIGNYDSAIEEKIRVYRGMTSNPLPPLTNSYVSNSNSYIPPVTVDYDFVMKGYTAFENSYASSDGSTGSVNSSGFKGLSQEKFCDKLYYADNIEFKSHIPASYFDHMIGCKFHTQSHCNLHICSGGTKAQNDRCKREVCLAYPKFTEPDGDFCREYACKNNPTCIKNNNCYLFDDVADWEI